MKSILKSESKKRIIKIEIDNENFYITAIDKSGYYSGEHNAAKVVKLTGDPQRANKVVRQSTIDAHIKSIEKFYSSRINNFNPKMSLFKLNNEYLDVLPENVKNTIKDRLNYYKTYVLWEDDNFNIKKAFIEKDWTNLRKLKTKLTLLFEKEQEYNKLKSINLNVYSTFTISVVDAKHEIRAEKLRRIEKHNNE